MFSLKRQLKKLQKRTSPSTDFKRELRATLDKEYNDAYGPLPQKKVAFGYKFAMAGVVAIVLAVSTGTGVYAYESPQVSEGHVLFPIKQGIERIECGIIRNPDRAAICKNRMVERRLNEAEVELDPEQRQFILERAAERLGIDPDELRRRLINRGRERLQELRPINNEI